MDKKSHNAKVVSAKIYGCRQKCEGAQCEQDLYVDLTDKYVVFYVFFFIFHPCTLYMYCYDSVQFLRQFININHNYVKHASEQLSVSYNKSCRRTA